MISIDVATLNAFIQLLEASKEMRLKPYVLYRQTVPRRMGDLASPKLLGGAADRFWGVAGTFHALASPHSNAPVPAAPNAGDPHAASLGYWGALHNILLYRLGWTRPDLGLKWWYEQGKPVDDPTLALVAQVWDADRRLDGYLSCLLHREWRFLNESGDGTTLGSAMRTDVLSPDWMRWRDAVDSQYSEDLYPWFSYATEGDSLHLSRSGGQIHGADPEAILKVLDPVQRTAVVLTDRADCWYFTLKRLGDELPGVTSSSWHVDLYVRSIGFMGTFRPSRDTGLWFTGRHRVHAAGSAPR